MKQNIDKARGKQLGMNYSSANQKLARMVLFDISVKFNINICFRCGLKINKYNDFSIDHKQSWLHVDAALFWDLSNIAFSHRRCNTIARRLKPRKNPQNAFMKWYSKPENAERWNKRRRELYVMKRGIIV